MKDAVAAEKHIGYLQQQIETARGYERLLKAKLAALRARPSINEVRADITTLELEKSELTDRLERLRSWKTKAVPLAEKEAADKAWAEWKRKAESRRRIFVEMWAVVVDGLSEGGLTKEVLWVRVLDSFTAGGVSELADEDLLIRKSLGWRRMRIDLECSRASLDESRCRLATAN